MNTLLTTLSDALQTPDVQRALLLIGIKSTLILALGGLVAYVLRGASSARRHLVWAMALGSVLLLPFLELALPTWRVALVPAPQAESFALAPMNDFIVEDIVVEPVVVFQGEDVIVAPAAPPAPHVMATRAPFSASLPPLAWLGLVWAAVAGGIGLYYLIGVMRLNAWTGKADPIEDEAIRQAARDVVWELDVQRPVALRWTDEALTPLTFGVFKPVVLLPRAAQEWDDERLRVVLLHEFAHIRRFDALTQMVAQAACALFWFNPLVWWGAGELRVERERACDDYVLERGTRASAYAAHLLEIARTLRARPPIGVVSMAHKGELEGRLLAILEPERRREILNRAVTIGAGVLFAAVLLPLAALKPWEVQAQPLHTVYAADMPDMPEPPLAPEPAGFESFDGLTNVEDSVAFGDATDTIRRSFDVRPGGTLAIRTDVGSIEVEPGHGDKVEIVVESNVDDFKVSFDQKGNTVSVRGDREGNRNWNWGRNNRVSFRVRVPQQFDVNLNTSGGSIEVGDLEGTVETKTSGGSLKFGRIRGTVKGNTSGGSIQLDGTTGNVDVNTSGGSIRLGDVGGTVKAHTSGGSIQIEEVGGDVDARTSGGSVTATITKQPRGRCALETSGGSVRVHLAEGLDLDLDASTSGGRVVSDFHPEHDRRERRNSSGDRLEDTIGKGGPELRLRTSAGSIYVTRLDGRSSSTRARDAAQARENAVHYSYSFTTDDGAEHEGDFETSMEAFGESLGGIVAMALEEAFTALDDVNWAEEMDRALSELDDNELREVEQALQEAQREMEASQREMAREMAEAQREMNRELSQAQRELSQSRRAEVEASVREAQQSLREAQHDIQEALREAQQSLQDVQRERATRRRQNNQ